MWNYAPERAGARRSTLERAGAPWGTLERAGMFLEAAADRTAQPCHIPCPHCTAFSRKWNPFKTFSYTNLYFFALISLFSLILVPPRLVALCRPWLRVIIDAYYLGRVTIFVCVNATTAWLVIIASTGTRTRDGAREGTSSHKTRRGGGSPCGLGNQGTGLRPGCLPARRSPAPSSSPSWTRRSASRCLAS